MLIPRDPMSPDQNLTSVRAPWRQLLTDHEQTFLTDNQLSVFVDKQGLGCEQIHFYPLPFAHHFAGGRWDFEEMVNHDCLRSNGPRLSLPVEPIELTFRPDRIDRVVGGEVCIPNGLGFPRQCQGVVKPAFVQGIHRTLRQILCFFHGPGFRMAEAEQAGEDDTDQNNQDLSRRHGCLLADLT